MNDDCFKILFAKGIGTNLFPSEFIGYSSVPLGFLLKWFYGTFSSIPWHGLYLVSAQFFGVWLFLYSLLLGPAPLWKCALFSIGFLSANVTFFSNLQFTISASLAAQGALFLLMRLLDRDNPKEIPGGFALIFISTLLAALIRFDELMVTLFCAIPFIFYGLRNNQTRLFKRSMIFFLLTCTMVLLTVPLFSHFWHEHKAGWHDFDLFDHERVEFQDYRIHAYTPQTKPFFDEAGWSENDLNMFNGWYFMDQDKYDWRNMQRLSLHFPRIGVDGKFSTFHSLWEIAQSKFGTRNLMVLFCLLFLVPLAEFRWFVLSCVWMGLFFLYMLYFWRAPDRLVYQELYYLLCLGIFWTGESPSLSPLPPHSFPRWVKKFGLVLLMLVSLTLFPSLIRIHSDNLKNVSMEALIKNDLARLSPNDNQLFIIWGSAFPFELFDAFDSYETFRRFHLFEFAVYQRSPDALPQLRKFGLRNPLVDMIGKPNVFIICKPDELKMYGRYLSENFPQKVLVAQYFTGSFFTVFQVRPWKVSPPGSKHLR